MSEKTVAPNGGRSSNGKFPFFNLSFEDEGAVIAIGWSGQWQFQTKRAANGTVPRHGRPADIPFLA